MMEWKKLSKKNAKELTAEWNSLTVEEFNQMKNDWASDIEKDLDDNYRSIRSLILEAYENAKESAKNAGAKSDYKTDLIFALSMYKTLKEYGMNERLASDDQIWVYLCTQVVPDIVSDRYKGSYVYSGDKRIRVNVNEDRMWKTSRRIYLKTLWWYIYLSLQPGLTIDEELSKTYDVLKNNTTDTIVQIVERSGRAGYRVDLYRKLIKYYSAVNSKDKEKLLRQVMVLNTSRTVSIEPELCKGGNEGYVKELFGYFGY